MKDEVVNIEVWHPVVLDEDAMRCRVLLLCVIYRAVRDYVATKRLRSLEERRLHAEAKSWLFSNRNDRFNSFAGLCSATNTHVTWWREIARDTKPNQLLRLELRGYRKTSGQLLIAED